MTQLDNVNRALAEIGTRSRLTVVDGSTTEGLYASLLYPLLRDSMLRMGDYDWSMEQLTAVPTTISTDLVWAFGYVYPTNTVRIRQAIPLVRPPFDPQPVEWNVATSTFGAFVNQKVILTQFQMDSFVVTKSDIDEASWDAGFTDAFIRYLGSSLTMALENRMEASETALKNALAFAGLANMRDD